MNNHTNNVQTQGIDIGQFVQTMQPVGSQQQAFVNFCNRVEPRISTGSLALDIAMSGGMTNELYILGAETSTGKSSFMMFVAENMARQGIDILYFSLEMSPVEFIARSISEISFIRNFQNSSYKKIPTSDILFWQYDPTLSDFTRLNYSVYESYANEYFETYGNHMYIIPGGMNGFCARDIANISATYKKQHPDHQVAVFVDYLQILKADPQDRSQLDRKTKTDMCVITLKTLAAQFGMPVFTASSINRGSYRGRITPQAFKESGDIEFTSGILIGWNWLGVTTESDEDKQKIELQASSARGYRKMELELLKFRNGKKNNSVKIIYYPAYNAFFDEYAFRPLGDEPSPFDTWDQTGVASTNRPAKHLPTKSF